MWAHSGGHPFFLKYNVAEMSAGSIAGILADICAGIRADICAGIVAGICAETLPRLFPGNDCRAYCRARNQQLRFFLRVFFRVYPRQ